MISNFFGGVQDDQTSVGSVESVPGGFIPLVQGARLPGEQLYLSSEEEIWQTVHAWQGAEMPAQSAVSAQDVEALARARLTHETGVAFGQVEEAFGNIDSKVESIGASLHQL